MQAKKPKKQPRPVKTAEERAHSGRCIINRCANTMRQRGLCQKHINTFWSQMRSLATDEERSAFETKCLQERLILARQEMRRFNTKSPFTKVKP